MVLISRGGFLLASIGSNNSCSWSIVGTAAAIGATVEVGVAEVIETGDGISIDEVASCRHDGLLECHGKANSCS